MRAEDDGDVDTAKRLEEQQRGHGGAKKYVAQRWLFSFSAAVRAKKAFYGESCPSRYGTAHPYRSNFLPCTLPLEHYVHCEQFCA
ncbi:hypothetical protein V9T40_011939 [Parthenolecanium corni]|uniref:Uncharacterized protein n=1 Tax=Parthenolecanium corni TaxID=536013 RepID=A0AAN9T6C9_9HEMI